jgi:hypothetical protein
MSLDLAVRVVFAIEPMSASDGNARYDWIDFQGALEHPAKPTLESDVIRMLSFGRDRLRSD